MGAGPHRVGAGGRGGRRPPRSGGPSNRTAPAGAAATLPRSSGPTPAPDDEFPDRGGDDDRGPGGASPDPVPKHTPARKR